MLQTGRSLWLEGGHRNRVAWSILSDPQRNSLVIVLRELEGKVAEIQVPVHIWIVYWLESASSLGKPLSVEHWSLSFARLWGESRERRMVSTLPSQNREARSAVVIQCWKMTRWKNTLYLSRHELNLSTCGLFHNFSYRNWGQKSKVDLNPLRHIILDPGKILLESLALRLQDLIPPPTPKSIIMLFHNISLGEVIV